MERSGHTSCRTDVSQKYSILVPFLISVSLHLAAAWTLSHVVKDAPHHQPMRPIEVDIITPIPEKTIPLAQVHSEPKVAALAKQLPRPVTAPVWTPPAAAPRPTTPALPQTVPAATSQEKSVTTPQPASTASLPHSSAPVAAGTANRSLTDTESGRADLPVVGPSYDAAYLSNPPPPYPAAARRLKLQGTVTVRVMVSPDGRPTSVTLEKGSGVRILDEAALEAVRHWSFVPARRGDKAIAALVDVPVRFRLN